MPRITFVQSDQSATVVDARIGMTAMEAARNNNVRGIKAECGGECSCSTCHCYVDPAWVDLLPPKRDDEAGLVEFAWEPRATSRLACQIRLTEALDGLVLHVPARQL
jgi:2Fe-2S ferredoxin